MGKRLIISENEKKEIQKLYGINKNDENIQEGIVLDLIGKGLTFLKNKSKEFTQKMWKKITGVEKDEISKEDLENLTDEEKKELEKEMEKESKKDKKEKSPKKVKFGKVKVEGSFDREQRKNISTLIDEMEKNGITNPYAQIGILSVVDKESGFIPQGEISYATTPNQQIRKIFTSRVASYSDEELSKLKKDPKKFFNVVYSKTVGNQSGNDGYIYRGRGFNQLTGRGNYKRMGEKIGMGNKLVENPELVNDPKIASKIAIEFLLKSKSSSSLPSFESKEDAASYFSDLNSGGSTFYRDKAIKSSKKFDVED
jgi:predicted chitinase